MSLKKNALATVALSAVAVAVSSAYAAGFQLSEHSGICQDTFPTSTFCRSAQF